MSIEVFLLFFFSTFMISATPGPNMLLAFQYGLNFGVKRTLWTLAGLSVGLFILLLSALLGIDMLTKQFPWALAIIKVIGGLYLAFLGIQSWRHANNNSELMTDKQHIEQAHDALTAQTMPTSHPSHPWQMFKKGVFVSLSNPKAILFFAAFFPKFINFEQPLPIQYLILTIGFFVSETIWQFVYLLGGKQLANWLQTGDRLAWLNRACGALFVLIAVGLIWEVVTSL